MNGWYKPSTPRKVNGGIVARTKRGSIGEQWWSRRFIDLLEALCDSGRLSRGRRYARAGQVLDMTLEAGRVTARVQGSDARPYIVHAEVAAFTDADWDAAVTELRSQALFRAKLLAGELPPEVEGLFESIGLPLFPESAEQWNLNCTCPDWGWPCKHLSAVLYLLAEAFDDDPFQVLAWRGRDREQLLDALRSAPALQSRHQLLDVADVSFAEQLDDFYSPRGRPKGREPSPRVEPDLLLRVTDPPDVHIRYQQLVDILAKAYSQMGTNDQPQLHRASRTVAAHASSALPPSQAGLS